MTPTLEATVIDGRQYLIDEKNSNVYVDRVIGPRIVTDSDEWYKILVKWEEQKQLRSENV